MGVHRHRPDSARRPFHSAPPRPVQPQMSRGHNDPRASCPLRAWRGVAGWGRAGRRGAFFLCAVALLNVSIQCVSPARRPKRTYFYRRGAARAGRQRAAGRVCGGSISVPAARGGAGAGPLCVWHQTTLAPACGGGEGQSVVVWHCVASMAPRRPASVASHCYIILCGRLR